ncbi:MAG: phospholipase D-like domain-containing protein [Candidatus Methanodesulfokora sp.]|nr:MAG: hypothetical protein C0200_05200 [Candidatus Korarchaeota archaeon]
MTIRVAAGKAEVILLLVLLFSGAIIVYQSNQYAKLNALYSQLQGRYNELEANYSSLKAEISSIKARCNVSGQVSVQQVGQMASCPRIYGPYFCPEDHCSNVVIYWVSKANKSIDLAMYSFTLDSIGDALIEAKKRGVVIRVIFERSQVNQWSEYSRLKSEGIQVMLDENDAYMHNKFMVIDGKVVLTGSYNYSKQADTQNDENLIVIEDGKVARAYEDEFNEMWSGIYGR